MLPIGGARERTDSGDEKAVSGFPVSVLLSQNLLLPPERPSALAVPLPQRPEHLSLSNLLLLPLVASAQLWQPLPHLSHQFLY